MDPQARDPVDQRARGQGSPGKHRQRVCGHHDSCPQSGRVLSVLLPGDPPLPALPLPRPFARGPLRYLLDRRAPAGLWCGLRCAPGQPRETAAVPDPHGVRDAETRGPQAALLASGLIAERLLGRAAAQKHASTTTACAPNTVQPAVFPTCLRNCVKKKTFSG